MSSRVTKTEPTFRCSRCVCVCVVGSCARKSVKVGCFFFGRRLCTKKPQKREKKREKKREFFSHKNERRRKNKRTRLCKESRLEEDSFFLSFVWKETFTRDNERKENAPKRAKNKEKRRERERDGKREREDLLGGEENQSEMDSDKQDGIQKLLRAEQEANAIVTAARQGGSRCSRPFARSFFFLVLGGGGRRTPGARFVRFLLGLFSMRRINLSTHTRSSSLFVWRRQKKRRESNKPKTKRRPRSNCTEINESNATSKWWRKPPVVPMK